MKLHKIIFLILCFTLPSMIESANQPNTPPAKSNTMPVLLFAGGVFYAATKVDSETEPGTFRGNNVNELVTQVINKQITDRLKSNTKTMNPGEQSEITLGKEKITFHNPTQQEYAYLVQVLKSRPDYFKNPDQIANLVRIVDNNLPTLQDATSVTDIIYFKKETFENSSVLLNYMVDFTERYKYNKGESLTGDLSCGIKAGSAILCLGSTCVEPNPIIKLIAFAATCYTSLHAFLQYHSLKSDLRTSTNSEIQKPNVVNCIGCAKKITEDTFKGTRWIDKESQRLAAQRAERSYGLRALRCYTDPEELKKMQPSCALCRGEIKPIILDNSTNHSQQEKKPGFSWNLFTR